MCVEPSDRFFSILSRNAAQFGDVELINKLYAPAQLIGKISFISGNQTGVSSVVHEGYNQGRWLGEHVTCDKLLGDEDKSFIIKTDTDGFDCHIIIDIIAFLRRSTRDVPIIFLKARQLNRLRQAISTFGHMRSMNCKHLTTISCSLQIGVNPTSTLARRMR